MKFVKPIADNKEINVEVLVQALFFARWCNRDHTLNEINPSLLSDPKTLKNTLNSLSKPPWCNETAYPVETVTWKGLKYSRLEAATDLFYKVSTFIKEDTRNMFL